MPSSDTQFKKGQSGNPGGRPKGLARQAREAAPEYELAEWYGKVWRGEIRPERVQLEAAQWLSERGYGKAAQFEPVKDGDPLELTNVDAEIHRVAGELDELADRRKAKTPRPQTTRAVAANGANGTTPASG